MGWCWACDIKKEGEEGQRHEDEFLTGNGREDVIRLLWMKHGKGKEGSITVVTDVTNSMRRVSHLLTEVEMCVHGVGRNGIDLGKEENKAGNSVTQKGTQSS